MIFALVPVFLALAYPLARRALRAYLLKRYTCIPDLEQLGTPSKGSKLRGTAVIAGGSVSGLFAARICADHFEKVIVVEPEAWTFTEEACQPANFGTREVKSSTATYNTWNHKRSRVYQYSAVHVYQALLVRFARKLFPGFDEFAKSWDMLIRPMDMNLCLSGHWLRPKNPAESIFTPRRNLEPLIRKLVREGKPEIEFVHGTVSGYQLGTDGSVNSVNVRLGSGEGREFTDCALAVDCSGIAQIGVKLLSRAIPTFPPDLRQTYNADIVYSTLEYPVPPNFDEELRRLNIPGSEKGDVQTAILTYNANPNIDNRIVALVRCDLNRVVFTTGGWAVDMPVTLEEVREFAKAVKNQDHIPDYFYKVIDLLEPVQHLGTVYEARVANCYKVDYARAANILPRNFVAIGDSSMRVNPRFGQGVTKCAIGAISLDSVLREMAPTSRNFGKTFFDRLTVRTSSVWDGTRFADYAAPTTMPVPGETRETGQLMRWYNEQVVKLLDKIPDLADRMWVVQMFLAPPTDLFSPSIVAHVLWETVRSMA
ncbi:hypothetical protein AURDEDRAFT_116817, partial [Auricularia subglabra TFB-10046 SS5]